MMHRVECGGDDCSCECRCHERCGAPCSYGEETCYRRPKHKHEHQARYSVLHRRKKAA